MADPITIGYGQNKWVKDSNNQVISLFFAGAGTNQYLKNDNGGGTYTVPAGKKFTLLMVLTMNNGGGALTKIYNNTSTDVIDQYVSYSSGGRVGYNNEVYVRYAAGDSIKITQGSSNTTLAYGVEEDA
jgi:hypothetical protein